jgi:hypothetical protein
MTVTIQSRSNPASLTRAQREELRAAQVLHMPEEAIIWQRADDESCTVARWPGRAGRVLVKVWFGKALKPAAYYSMTPEKADKQVEDWFASAAAQKQARKPAARALQVGHILVSSWGYDQTNIDWYRVERLVGETMVELVKLGAVQTRQDGGNWLTGQCVPDIDGPAKGEPFRVRANGDHVRLSSYSYAYLWDGRPRSWSAYA